MALINSSAVPTICALSAIIIGGILFPGKSSSEGPDQAEINRRAAAMTCFPYDLEITPNRPDAAQAHQHFAYLDREIVRARTEAFYTLQKLRQAAAVPKPGGSIVLKDLAHTYVQWRTAKLMTAEEMDSKRGVARMQEELLRGSNREIVDFIGTQMASGLLKLDNTKIAVLGRFLTERPAQFVPCYGLKEPPARRNRGV